MSWSEIKSLKKSEIESTFTQSKILLCKRNPVGQVYVAKGFRDMVHFTVGPEGKNQLCNFLKKWSIKYYELRGFDSDMEAPSWFKVNSMPTKVEEKGSPFLHEMNSKMKGLAKVFIPHLMKVSFQHHVSYYPRNVTV